MDTNMKLIIKPVKREWRDLKEKSYNALSFSLEGRPGEILMTEDLDYPNCHDLHPINATRLTKEELGFLAQSIIDYIPSTHYLLTCGESWKEKEDLFGILSGLLSDTGCLRTLKDCEGGLHYYPILKKP
jgi:hypothetical protein